MPLTGAVVLPDASQEGKRTSLSSSYLKKTTLVLLHDQQWSQDANDDDEKTAIPNEEKQHLSQIQRI